MNNYYVFNFISVVYIKDEPEDTAFDVRSEPALNSFLNENDNSNVASIIENYKKFEANDSMDKLDIKEEPLQDDVVSKCLCKVSQLI